MRIAVFGATGMAGRAIVAEGLERGHHILGLSRHPENRSDHARLTNRAADVADAPSVGSALAAVDAAVLTIRLQPGAESGLAPLTAKFLDVARQHGTRILVVGGASPLRSPEDPDRLLIDDPRHVPHEWKQIAQASLDQLRRCETHPYTGWIYLSPAATLEPGTRTGRYRRGTDTLLTDAHGVSRISVADLAIAVVDELETPGDVRHFTVAEDLPR